MFQSAYFLLLVPVADAFTNYALLHAVCLLLGHTASSQTLVAICSTKFDEEEKEWDLNTAHELSSVFSWQLSRCDVCGSE